jgi:hypothetical protein
MSVQFTSTPVNREGTIYYYFKGMRMSNESARVVDQANNIIVVERDKDRELFTFVNSKGDWLLKDNETSNSLLFGTRFVFVKNENI